MTEERRIQLVAEVDTTGTRAGFNEISRQAEGMAANVSRSGEQAERAVADIGSGANASARQVEAAQRNLIGAIQRTTAQMEAGSRSSAQYFEVLARQRGVDPSVLAPFLAQLRAVEQAQGRANAALNTAPQTLHSVGVSAAQTANAMRQVPAQFMDIVTSLQGGQAPLTVLLQQGGQLRDTFGSTGAAARGLATYVAGLVTPYTVAAAAAGGLLYLYNTGAREADAYTRAIISTGNAAGATANNLAQLAREVGEIKGSQGEAADALVKLTSTGQVSYDNLRQFTMVAIDVQRVLGQAVADTAAQFADLGRSPLQALEKINSQYHFITAATYAQVKALQDQGKATEAAEVAQRAYAEGIDKQRQKVLDSLSDWERGWIRIKAATSGALDSLFNVGRGPTDFEKINALLNERETLEANLANAQKMRDERSAASYQSLLDRNKQEINQLREKQAQQNKTAKAEADAAQVTDARNKWLQDGDKYLSRSAQLERELTKARNEGAAAQVSQAEIDKRLASIRKSYADIYNDAIDSNIAALKRRDQVADLLTQREIARVEAARAAGSMTEDDAINAVAKAQLDQIARRRQSLQQELDLTKQKASSEKEQAELRGQINELDEQSKTREIQLETDLAAAEQRRYRVAVENSATLLESWMVERNSLVQGTQAQLDYNEQIGLTKKQIGELTATRLRDLAARKEEEAAIAENLDLDGKRAGILREQATALRARAAAVVEGADKEFRYDQFKRAVDQYDQIFQIGFADMLNHGRDGWKSFTQSLVTTFKTSVADQIYKMFVRPIVVQMVGSFLGVNQQAIASEMANGSPAVGATGSGPIGTAMSAANLYKATSSGFQGFGNSVAEGYDSIAGMFGPSTIGSTGPSATGSSVGAASSVAAAYVAGVQIGRALGNSISGEYGVTSNNRAFVNWNTLLSPWAIGGGVLGGLVNRAFGRGPVEVQAQGIRGTLSDAGLTGTSYQQMHQDGGWFRSDKNWEQTQALSSDVVKQFNEAFASIKQSSTGFAQSIGADAALVTNYAKAFDLALTGDAAKDQQMITDLFQGIGNEIANQLVPNLSEFSKSGETASAALQRLAGDFQATTQMAQMLGKSAVAVFGSKGMDSAGARERLIELFGGTQPLGQLTGYYAQNYLTEAERLKPVQEALDEAMQSLGLSSVKTREQFKAVIDCLDLTTEAGAKQFAAMMQLAEAFAQVHPVIESTTDQLQLMQQAAAGLLGDVDSAFGVLQKVVDREKAAVQQSVNMHSEAVAKLSSLSQALHSTLDSISAPDQKLADRAMAQAEIRADLAITKAGGSLSDGQVESLKKALGVVTQDATSQFSSYADWLRDLVQTQSDIAGLAGITDRSLSVEERALAAAQDQLKSLDALLANAQDQVDVLKGQSTTLLSISDALGGLASAILGAKANPMVAASEGIASAYQQYLGRGADAAGLEYWQKLAANGTPVSSIIQGIAGSGEAQVRKLYKDLLGRTADSAGLDYWLHSGASMDAIRKAIEQSDEYKKLHPFDVGTNYVPQTMPALVHKGERIIPAADNRALLARLSSSAENSAVLATEIRELRAEVELLRKANSAENLAIAGYTQRSAETSEKWDATGIPATRTA